MYAEALIARSQARLEAVYHAALPQGLTRHPVAFCESMAKRLANAVDPAGVPQRRLTPEEDTFIANERLLSKIGQTPGIPMDCWQIFAKLVRKVSHLSVSPSWRIGSRPTPT